MEVPISVMGWYRDVTQRFVETPKDPVPTKERSVRWLRAPPGGPRVSVPPSEPP